ncbi:8-amino-7-oxononanoate synthase [Lysinibacillus sphaericus]|uniref:8-amino-7-oxononanoate synthase n=2 Tax=Lysinibacillus sphaericus TaxID=1421 RepID=BIOF_LYSSH|nr:8-amino-7-oxononanoate synthase [Lysinibacillus sphaericus]P22806.1 RecName: Full=8-amino-7-oxononanoate synthase; Short=AONS; AltName: Full=7-keto-8-amino-pelargonic acid synthase; Short=7-KAP synthase; AltName: Full=8-amino-7-ketopelargonate synthase [Lysinibacillus sphaericus]AAA22271.1 7-keto-8-aminopelargonic acid synthetase (bioF) [Lysinibacillus sphaericus]AVK98480.1 8-amino-7-oxononanoate synthase [Lysinibacillus sphaericus]MED4544005.1 8-amino-7-oxononanoate synthase [Lysinibacillus
MNDRFRRELQVIEEQGLTRKLRLFSTGNESEVVMNGKKFLLFSSNNYLGLATDSRLKKKATEGISKYGTGAGGSRLTTGNFDIHEQLESEIADFKKTEAAIVFSSGYLANVGVISSVMKAGDTIFSDAWNHASIIDGCRLSKAKTIVYEHADMVDLERKLRQSHGDGLKFIVTDGVFSMDGDIAPLPKIVELAKEYKAYIMIDDAHATGVLGNDGCGTADYFGLKDEIDFTVGTLSKAIGAEGGFVSTSSIAKNYLLNNARSFIFQTALSPSAIEAAREGISIIQNEPERRKQLLKNAQYLRLKLEESGFVMKEGETPIISLIIGGSHEAMQFSAKLLDEGVFIPAIRPPTVPKGSSRLRITVMATHTIEQLDMVISKIKKIGKEMGIV